MQQFQADRINMKRIIVIFLILVPAVCFAQNKKSLSHFWSIPWGTTMDRAEAIFLERELVPFRNANTIMAEAVYERENSLIILVFNQANRLHSAHVIYSSCPETAIAKYEHYRLVLFRRYGLPNTAVAYFEEPFENGDGREIEAIQTESALFFTEWDFEDGCFVSLSILSSLDVSLTYRNPAFADSR